MVLISTISAPLASSSFVISCSSSPERAAAAGEQENHAVLRAQIFHQLDRPRRGAGRIFVRNRMARLIALQRADRSHTVAVFCDDNAAVDFAVHRVIGGPRHLPGRLARRDDQFSAGKGAAAQRLFDHLIRQRRPDRVSGDLAIIVPKGAVARRHLLTTLTGAPARNARTFSTVVSIMRWRLSFGAQEICGVRMQFFAPSSGLSGRIGSV